MKFTILYPKFNPDSEEVKVETIETASEYDACEMKNKIENGILRMNPNIDVSVAAVIIKGDFEIV